MTPGSFNNVLSSSASTTSGSSGRTRVDSLQTPDPSKITEGKVITLTTGLTSLEPPSLRSETSSPVSTHSDANSLIGSTRSSRRGMRPASRSHPYLHRGAPSTQLELRFALKGIRGTPDIKLTDAIKGRDIFLRGLSSLSSDTITLAAHAKHAARENHRHKVKQLGWEIQEVEYNKLLLKAFERKEKKRLKMAESDYRLFEKLLVGRDLPALQQDAEYLEESHDSELDSLATADEQLYQISSVSPLATKYVSHRLPNSSDTEYEQDEEEADNGERSDDSDYSDAELEARSTGRRKPNAARKGFRPGIHSDLNPSGQSVANQLALPGDRATTPAEHRIQMPISQQHHAQLEPHYHQPPPPQYSQPQHQAPLMHHQQPPAMHHQHPLVMHHQQPPPMHHQQPPPMHHQQPPPMHHRDEDRALADAYAGAFALLHEPSSRQPSQPDLVGNGSLAPWGAARLVALAPLHLGENIRGERTQGVIRTQKHVSDSGRRRRNVRLPPTPELLSADPAAAPDLPEGSGSIVDPPISTRIKLSTKSARKLKETAKSKLRALLLNVDAETDGAPNDELRDKMIRNALQATKIEQFGQAEIEDIKGINNFMVAAIADMRRGFKAYAMKTVPVGYGLRLPLFSEQDESAHGRDRSMGDTEVRRLLENEVLINMVIDLLKDGLSDIVKGPLDRLFAACGATIRCVLYAHRTGHFVDFSVNSSIFDDAYHEIMNYITTTIHPSDTLRERFAAVQQELHAKYSSSETILNRDHKTMLERRFKLLM
ncbi:uncharacterized protein F5147DRAFT_648951 [Suillus discolor]|uniref:Uncharacterized protein n=1 Tax=Suillus discolor TaxID=1912936 RepID=A0A9P7JYM1_9AGAM|nr:uncharacterized protein F5147DRAFT_648951 [Suillus discolor]KAG2116453.1 hypothetical protein F5147DRAFT_648951 [Suillus discolor]